MNIGEDTSNGPARHRMPWRILMAAALLFALPACETTPKGPAPETAAPTPADNAPLSRSTNIIHVMPVEGLDGPLRLVLADAVAASLRDTERPAMIADAPNNQGPTILIGVENVRERGSVVWVTTRWKLRAPYGTVVAERTREMVIDKTLWEQTSVETVNLIIDDAMPAVSAMVQDYVGPLHVADPAPVDVTVMAPEPVQSQSEPTPILGREPLAEAAAEPATTLPPQVGAPQPPEPAESFVLSLPATETDPEPPLIAQPAPAEPIPAARPPMILAPGQTETAAPAPMPAQTEGAVPQPAMPTEAPPPQPQMPAEPAEPRPLSAPLPPKTTAAIGPGPADTPVQWGKPAFLIRTVRGAPGNGNQALAVAITSALRAKDLTVTEDPRQAGYEVVGEVDVGPPVNGRQRARITWKVNTMGGQEVGKAVQENVIAAGSLDRNWGQVAVLVSSAAANGIHQLFEAPRPKYTPVGSVPAFPNIPPLPRVPGRALPPPS